jgi:Cu-processing system permease protein
MRLRVIQVLISREIRACLRGRWFLLGAAGFGILSIAVAHLGSSAGASGWGISTVDRTTAALMNLILLFVPLLGIPLGATSFAGESEDGTLGYLIAQPLSRLELFAGKWLGLIAAITMTLGLGFGITAIWMGFQGALASNMFWAMALGAWLLAIFSISLGAFFASISQSRMQALAFSVAAWLFLVFLCDFGILALAVANIIGAKGIFAISIINPLQAVKIFIAMFVSQRLEVLGPAGIHAIQTFGSTGLILILLSSLAIWMSAVTGFGFLRFRRENFL